ncbi:GNAT family N-acetyltransferase [Terrabacter sp. Root181]|uniref:GNAT family N-acetyltransferase n=1 Tax=Terrabacter sp. Root181 TaxID=1736484 RepID=UPI0006F251AE|nr:GNAT family N-acetyltransferase [Terrabacter sp. Root181]KRB47960.1 acetyltransferase [Terrabacter sp. Root181]
MSIELGTPGVEGLVEAVHGMRPWPRDGMPVQLHPGDLGWNWSHGAEATAAAVRTWHRDGRLVAVGLLDEPRVLRMAIAPEAGDDDELAQRLLGDVAQPGRGVLPAGEASVEARFGDAFRARLAADGWGDGEAWTPLVRDLADPVEERGLRVEVVGADPAPERLRDRVAVQRASFDTSTFTEQRWRAMASGPAYTDARCLVGYDDGGAAVATATVWAAGPGRPGLIEPLGAHRDHRGRGHGRAITLACAAALRDLGSSSALVCTPSANVVGVATYVSAGFRRDPVAHDLHRDA